MIKEIGMDCICEYCMCLGWEEGVKLVELVKMWFF